MIDYLREITPKNIKTLNYINNCFLRKLSTCFEKHNTTSVKFPKTLADYKALDEQAKQEILDNLPKARSKEEKIAAFQKLRPYSLELLIQKASDPNA